MKKVLVSLSIVASVVTGFAMAADPRAEIEKTFDRHKGGLYAIYAKALRENPRLAGKVVVGFDIDRSGSVSACRVQSSTLGSPATEQQFCDRILKIKFAPQNAAITITKPIDFFPAA